MNIVQVVETITVLGVVCGLGIVGFIQWIKHLSEEEQRARGEWKSGELVDGTWTCRECGSFNAKYLVRCGKCFVPKSDTNEK